MKILFLSHGYPPTIGGIENQNYNLANGLSKIAKVKIIANGKGKVFLPIFLPLAFLRAFFSMGKYDACLMGSGVLAPLGRILKFFHPRKKFFCIIHGLDVNFAGKEGLLPKIYARINLPALAKMDHLFSVGKATVEEAVKFDIDQDLCTFIPNGVNVENFKQKHTRKELEQIFGSNVDNKKVIFRLGRFVPHKGTSWFIDNIMPKLPQNVVMVAAGGRVGKGTAGDKDDFITAEQAIISNHLEKRVKLIPCAPQKDVLVLLNTADLVVAPNVKTPGTMEGFGLNAIEAGACERVIIASNLEGLATAIKNGKNGFLVEPEDIEQWTTKISKILDAGDAFARAFGKRAREYVEKHYTWDKICQQYLDEMKKY